MKAVEFLLDTATEGVIRWKLCTSCTARLHAAFASAIIVSVPPDGTCWLRWPYADEKVLLSHDLKLCQKCRKKVTGPRLEAGDDADAAVPF